MSIISVWNISFTLLPYVKYVCFPRVTYPPQPYREGSFSHMSRISRLVVGITGLLPSIAAPPLFAKANVLWNTLTAASWFLIVVISQHSHHSSAELPCPSLSLCHWLFSFLEMSKSRWLTHPAFKSLSFLTLILCRNFSSILPQPLVPTATP